MKINSILIGLMFILGAALAIMLSLFFYRGLHLPKQEAAIPSVDPMATPGLTPYKSGTGSLEKKRTIVSIKNGSCSPTSVTVKSPVFVNWVNNDTSPVKIKDIKTGIEREIASKASVGQFFSNAGAFSYGIGNTTCSVTVQ